MANVNSFTPRARSPKPEEDQAMRSLFLGIFLSIFCIPHAYASVSVDDLYLACSNAKSLQTAKAICFEYMAGVMDGISSHSLMTHTTVGFCPPHNLTIENIAPLYVEGIDGDIGLKTAPTAGIALTVILQRSFPCGRRRS